VSGKNGGYYGCLAATKGGCENKTLVRRTLVEKVILEAVKDELADPEHVAYVLRRVEEEVAKLRSDLPDTLKLKESELSAEQRRLANFVDFIGEGRGSQALAKALAETERRVEALSDEVETLRRSREKVFQAPPMEWIKPRLENLHEVLAHRTARAAQLLRHLLWPIRLDLVSPDIGRPLLPRCHIPRHARLNRSGPRWCGGRFEFFAKVGQFPIPQRRAIRGRKRVVCSSARRFVFGSGRRRARTPRAVHSRSGQLERRVPIYHRCQPNRQRG
jgi:hypothetical protein